MRTQTLTRQRSKISVALGFLPTHLPTHALPRAVQATQLERAERGGRPQKRRRTRAVLKGRVCARVCERVSACSTCHVLYACLLFLCTRDRHSSLLDRAVRLWAHERKRDTAMGRERGGGERPGLLSDVGEVGGGVHRRKRTPQPKFPRSTVTRLNPAARCIRQRASVELRLGEVSRYPSPSPQHLLDKLALVGENARQHRGRANHLRLA